MSNITQTVSNSSLEKYAEYVTKRYGIEVLENRAVPDYRDGLKPVHRAILWAMYKLKLHHTGAYKKSARVVGEVIGIWWPHGDASTYKALVNLVNSPVGMIDGYGNYGSHVEPAGAYRYTECRLSKFSDHYLLDQEYIDVMEMQKNFSEDQEIPIVLPEKVTNVLLVSNTSIAVGVSADSPPFELAGVIELTKIALQRKVTKADCLKHLKFNFKYGGKCISSKEDLMEYYETGNKTLVFEPSYVEDLKHRTFTITSTCPGLSSENAFSTLFKNIAEIPGVKLIHDAEDSSGIKYVIEFGKVGDDKIIAGFETIKKLIVKKEKYNFGVIEKSKDTQFFRPNISDVLARWCDWRIGVEKLVIANRIKKSESEIARYKLLLLAIASLSVIIEALKKDDPEKHLMVKLGITEAQASYIMDLKLRQLKKLEKKVLMDKMKAESEALKQHKVDYSNPTASVLLSLKSIKI